MLLEIVAPSYLTHDMEVEFG